MPGIRLREVFDPEMTFSIGQKPLLQHKTNGGFPVSVYRIPERSSLAPEGYLAAWIFTENKNLVITYSPSQQKTAMALANSIVVSSLR
jgi:hypothetical protein